MKDDLSQLTIENAQLKAELLKANNLLQIFRDTGKEYYEIKIKLIKEQQ